MGSPTSPSAPKSSDTLAPTMATDVPTEDLVGRKMRSTTKEESSPIHDAGYERALSSGKSGKSPGKSVNIAKVAKVQEDESSAEDNTAYTIKSVKKIAHATLIDTEMVKPSRHETY